MYDLEGIVRPLGTLGSRDVHTIVEVLPHARETAHLMLKHLTCGVELLLGRLELSLGQSAPVSHLVQLPQGLLAMGESAEFVLFSHVHLADQLLDLLLERQRI